MVDSIDMKILKILNQNARTPYDKVGQLISEKKTGLTGNAVRTRVMRMIKECVIQNFIFKMHPGVFNVSTCYAHFQYSNPIDDIINKIGNDPRFSEIITGIDGTTIIQIYGYNESDLLENIEELQKTLNLEFENIFKRHISTFKEVQINNSLMKVINCLIKDVRMTIANLAKECNMTSKSIKYYLSEIESKKIGRYSLNYQPYKASKRIFVNFFVGKRDTDHIHIASIFELLKKELREFIFQENLIVDPPGIFTYFTTESTEEIDLIEQKISSFLKEEEGYILYKFIPSKVYYRDNLIHDIVKNRMIELEKSILDE